MNQADFKIKVSEMDHHIEVEKAPFLKTHEPHEVFFQLQGDIKQLEITVEKIQKVDKKKDKKELLKLLIIRDEWANKFERLLIQFQQTWSISPTHFQEHLTSIHQMRQIIQQIKETANSVFINDLKKELSLFQEFFILPLNTNKIDQQGANQKSNLCNH